MNNASSYAFDQKAKYLYDSDQEQEYEFRGTNIVRTQKSMSMISTKQKKTTTQTKQMKKSNSFLLSNKPKVQKNNKTIEYKKEKDKDKTKTSKKCLNITEIHKKPPINSKNSMNKTSVSINSSSNANTNKSVKSLKKRSVSQDFLILNQQIYQCDNIEQINQKLVCGGQNSTIYSHERFIKATLRNQEKIQIYLQSFSQYIKHTKKNPLNITFMTNFQKKKLYNLLKSETTIQSSSNLIRSDRNNNNHINSFNMQNLIEQAVNTIEKKTDQIINQRPYEQIEVRKWKNQKLHDLMKIHNYLNSDSVHVSSERLNESLVNDETQQNLLQSSIQDKLQVENQLIQRTQQMLILQNNRTTNFHIMQQRYPQKINVKHEIIRYLPQEDLFSNFGIQNFLHYLWDYLVDNQIIPEMIQNFKQPYSISSADKRILLQSDLQNTSQWTVYVMLKTKNILKDQIFINFCKANYQNNIHLEQQQQRSLIIFHKAIFDNLNAELSKFQTDFPFGPYHPLQQNQNHSAYIIDQQNAMQVWDQCINNIIAINKLGLGSLVTPQSEQMQRIIKKNYQQSFNQWLKLQKQYYIQQRIRPLTRRKTIQQLICHIQSELLLQLGKQLHTF